jgi:hypothetical protein
MTQEEKPVPDKGVPLRPPELSARLPDSGGKPGPAECFDLTTFSFRGLFEKHAAVELLIDPQTGRIVDANEAASQFYG